jgi:hemolysin III
MLVHTYTDTTRFISLLIFGLSMIVLYAFSAVYHIGPWQGRQRTVLRAVDHANIFVLIAGTYTPFCVNVLAGSVGATVLTLIWSLAIAGVVSAVLTCRLPRWVTVALYIMMGWVAIGVLPWLLTHLPATAVATMFAGGALYTIGAIIYALQRPNPLPRIFGYHEVFHLFTIAGGAAFVIAIWSNVVARV